MELYCTVKDIWIFNSDCFYEIFGQFKSKQTQMQNARAFGHVFLMFQNIPKKRGIFYFNTVSDELNAVQSWIFCQNFETLRFQIVKSPSSGLASVKSYKETNCGPKMSQKMLYSWELKHAIRSKLSISSQISIILACCFRHCFRHWFLYYLWSFLEPQYAIRW